ncbi:oxygenase MpaB family protein [Labedaea rhizosphaerae]|uniref:oxygenase MpaB family protein n=1 Tax=Labedaea rhizosphaerae TaxID=598644 RepID=UPI001FB7C66A|nr:oxygenase MpaB family protein [Labedaea rhizosphaerae]
MHADPAMWIAGISSLFFQALHPLAVAGVVQNSDFQRDPLGRLFRTADFVGVTTYGSTEQAHRIAAKVRSVHAVLRARDPRTGDEFRLDRPDLLLWVHCAEVASFLSVVRRGGYPLSEAHGDQYVNEQRRSAALVGLELEDVPGSLAELRAYLRSIRPQLRRTDDAMTIYRFLHRPPVKLPWRLGLPVYQPLAGHLAYSVLPRWARAHYGKSAYPPAVATSMLRSLRAAMLAIPRRGHGPHIDAAVREFGADVLPSPRRLPA